MPMISVTPELKAVISLLEDTDPVVKESVDTYIKEHFAEIEYLLPDILDEWHFSRKESALLFDKMVAVNAELTMAELEKAVKEVPEDYIYEWFLLNKMILISADFTVMSASLISMANVLEQGITASDSPWKKAEVFNSAFFGKLGLVQLKSESIPLSALLPSEVTDTREGIPLVIDMLYVFLADMLGFPFRIYIQDGKFMPVWTSPDGYPLFFVDLDEEGRLLSPYDATGEREPGRVVTEDPSSLLAIYAAVLSDIFFASGENEKGRLMQMAHNVLTSA